jgi:serine/threonine protein phosphatase PrpC
MWKTLCCEAQGRSHIHAAIPCQDKTHACAINCVQVIALADGAGSAALSHVGADMVVNAACEYITENFEDLINTSDGANVKKLLLSHLLDRLRTLSHEQECEISALASTLLVAAVKGAQFMIAHVGDGVIGFLKNDSIKVASTPENGEYTNTTTFVTSKDALMAMKLYKGELNGITGFVLMSDGTAESFYNKRVNTLAPALKKIMHWNVILPSEIMQAMLKRSFEMIISQKTSDDCSIAVMSRESEIFSGYFDLLDLDKYELLGIKPNTANASKRLYRFNDILQYLETSSKLEGIAKHIHLKPKYTKRHLDSLQTVGLIEYKGSLYISNVRKET